MRFIQKLKIWLLFKLRVYEIRQISAVRQGSVILEDGAMYALSPCELMNYAYLFFYNTTGRISDDSSDSALREFKESADSGCRDLRLGRLNLYWIFKRGKRTGFLLVKANGHYQPSCHAFYSGYHVWTEITTYPFPGYYDEECIKTVQHAAVHMLASDACLLGKKVNIELFNDDVTSNDTCTRATKILRSKMIELMQECRESKDGFIYKASSTGEWGGYRNPTIKRNIERYIQEYDPNTWLEWADADGNEDSLNALATQYYAGDGVSKDLARAVRLWRKAAANGHADARYNLWRAYSNGAVKEISAGDALIYLGGAAHEGHPEAQFNLGVLYQTGDGVRRDPNRAMSLISEAAKKGSLSAQEFLANKKA